MAGSWLSARWYAAPQPGLSGTNTFDQIGAAFAAAMARNGSAAVLVPTAVIVSISALLFVRWLRRGIRRDAVSQERESARREVAMDLARNIGVEEGHKREWLRVTAHLRLCLRRTSQNDRVLFEETETQDVSAGGVSFLSHRPPTAGAQIEFDLYLESEWPMHMRGEVVSVEPPRVEGARSLVVAKFQPITPLDREQLARWVAATESRAVAQTRRGRVCERCGHPLADDSALVHSTCAKGR